MKVLISAAETSSDAHAAELLRALRRESSEEIDAYGIGGPKLAAEGLRQIFDARELLSMGFVEILGRLPKILSALRKIEGEARAERPDVAVLLDYPDFHFRLAKKLSKMGIPLVYYIPPKIWAWRKGRVRLLRRFFKRILCILPFEEEFYRRAEVSARYVGNPLQDELPLQATRKEAREKLGLAPSDRVLAVLAGSRPSELQRHLSLFLDSSGRLAQRLERRGLLLPGQKLHVLLPFAGTSSLEQMRDRVEQWRGSSALGGNLELRLSQGDSAWAMRAADAGIIKSGTSTLEAALMGLPNVIAYRPSSLSCFIVRHLIRYRRPVGLSNLIAESRTGRVDDPKLRARLITELICSEVTVEALSSELEELFWDSSKSRQVRSALDLIRAAVLQRNESPSLLAAREILEVVGNCS